MIEMERMKVKLTLPDAKMPVKAHEQDAGYDVFSPIDFTVPAHTFTSVDTGVCVQLEAGKNLYIHVASKSSHMLKGLTCDGTVDEGYTGSIRVCLFNHSLDAIEFHKGDKIAQLIVMDCHKPNMVLTEVLEESERGTGGFGSTGIR